LRLDDDEELVVAVIAAPAGSVSKVWPALASSTAHDEIPPVQYVSGVDGVIPDWGGVGNRWGRLSFVLPVHGYAGML
jgi:hypothetical protein